MHGYTLNGINIKKLYLDFLILIFYCPFNYFFNYLRTNYLRVRGIQEYITLKAFRRISQLVCSQSGSIFSGPSGFLLLTLTQGHGMAEAHIFHLFFPFDFGSVGGTNYFISIACVRVQLVQYRTVQNMYSNRGENSTEQYRTCRASEGRTVQNMYSNRGEK